MSSARSAYIHIPFCSHRCGYCNFTLVAGRDELIPAFLTALAGELAHTLGEPQSVDTIFLGGGTPTHLPPQSLEQLLQLLAHWLKLEAGGEYSCEANPLDCTAQRLGLLRDYGVNRISLGGQSFNDAKLLKLERDHSGSQLAQALERCHEIFPRVALDLIFASPEETLAEWQADVAMAVASPVSHLSTYGLTIERGSAFYGRTLRNELHELTPELQLEMYEHAIDELTACGWEHYEVSNFACPGERCRHNEAYWMGSPWWAFGPGAASFEHAADGQTFTRRVNHRSTTTYIRKQRHGEPLISESDQLSREDFVRERFVFGLRRLAGVDLAELNRWWGGSVRDLFEPHLSQYIERNWLAQTGDTIYLTRTGLVISDGLWPDLLDGVDESRHRERRIAH